MSAFMVSKKHIDLMVKTAIEGPRDRDEHSYWNWDGTDMLTHLGYTSAAALGQALVDVNLKSVNYRYPEESETAEPYSFKYYPTALTCVEFLKAIHCYEYQSCEHPEWETSKVRWACQELIKTITHSLPGYDAAPWGID